MFHARTFYVNHIHAGDNISYLVLSTGICPKFVPVAVAGCKNSFGQKNLAAALGTLVIAKLVLLESVGQYRYVVNPVWFSGIG